MFAVATPFDPSTAIGSAIDSLNATLTGVAPQALVVGASVIGLGLAWKLVRRFAK